MTQKQKNNIIALFGNKLRKEPFLIDTDTSIGEKRETLKKNNDPDVILKTMNETHFGNTFNKILPDMEPYLKTIYQNRNSSKRLMAATEIATENLEFAKSYEAKPSLEMSIEQKLKQMPKPTPKTR